MDTAIDPVLREELEPLLEPGEMLLWADRPDPLRFVRARIVQALFGVLFFLLMSLAASAGRAGSAATVDAGSLSLSFRPAALSAGILLTVYSMLLPVLAYRKALRTLFVATDRRVLSHTRGHRAQSMRFSDMQTPILEPLSAGTGDILFRKPGPGHGPASAAGQLHFRGVREAENLQVLVVKRLAGPAAGRIEDGAVPDYIDMLARGKRTLDDKPNRK